jgi:hypothetical protein
MGMLVAGAMLLRVVLKMVRRLRQLQMGHWV